MSIIQIDENAIHDATRVSIESVLRDYNAKFAKRNGDNLVYYCPFHDDRNTPNLYVSQSRNVWHCWGCGLSGNPIHLVGYLEFGESYNKNSGQFLESVKKLISNEYTYADPEKEYPQYSFKETLKDIRGYINSLSDISLEYLWQRGIQQPYRYGIGERSIDTIKYITFPIFKDKELIALKCRRNDLHSKHNIKHYTIPGSNCNYPYQLFGRADKRIFFFEDMISAISAKELGFPSVSLCGGNSIPKRGREFFKNILANKEIIIIPDNDKAGRKLIQDIEDLKLNVIGRLDIPDYKDFNDLVQGNKMRAFNLLLERIK